MASAFGFGVFDLDERAAFTPAVLAAISSGSDQLVLVHTDRARNVEIHAELDRAVEASLWEPARQPRGKTENYASSPAALRTACARRTIGSSIIEPSMLTAPLPFSSAARYASTTCRA